MSELMSLEREQTSPKRRQMLEAADALFLEQGYEAVSMDAVAKAAGVSKATLYAHFASKDRLFATIVAELGIASLLDETKYPAKVDDMRGFLTDLGNVTLRFMLRERTLRIYRIAVAESARFPELGQAFFDNGPRRTCARFEGWMAQQQTAGTLRAADPKTAASQFMALLRCGVFMRATLAVPPAPTEAEVTATVAAAVDTWLLAFGRTAPV